MHHLAAKETPMCSKYILKEKYIVLSCTLLFCETNYVSAVGYNLTHPFYLSMSTTVPSQHIATHLSSFSLANFTETCTFPAKSGCSLTISVPVADLLAAGTSAHCAIRQSVSHHFKCISLSTRFQQQSHR